MAKKEDFMTVILKNSTVPGRVPAPKDLKIGEIALSLYKGEESIWAKNSEGDVVKLNSITAADLWQSDSPTFKSYTDYSTFEEDLNAGSISPEMIIFISDPAKRGIWTGGQFYPSVLPEDYLTKEEAAEIYLAKESAEDGYVKNTDLAEPGKDGLMSKEDKVRLDNIYYGDRPVVSPVLEGEWKIYDKIGDLVGEDSSKTLIIEKGFQVQWEGTYLWNTSPGYKDPTHLGPGSWWNTLTESGQVSDILQTEQLTESTNIKIELQALKTGLTFDENDIVIPTSGYDTSSDEVNLLVYGRIYTGLIDKSIITESDLPSLDTTLAETKELLLEDVTAEEDEYFVYAYPKRFGKLSAIIQDGGTPILGALSRQELTITNQAGEATELYIYVSNNPGAFTDSSLEFK